MKKSELIQRLRSLPLGQQEYVRRFCLCVKAAHQGRWGVAFKWAQLCGREDDYRLMKNRADCNLDIFGR